MTCSRCYVITDQDVGVRLDVLLAEHGCYASRSAAAKAIEAGQVLVSGQPATKKMTLSPGDAVVYQVQEAPSATPLVGQPIPLDIRYEDDDLIVLSKQAGLVCHPSADHDDHTLVNALIYRYGVEHLCNVQGEDDRLGIVHRLDQDTSGLMLAAKTDGAAYELMEDIRARSVDRRYIALVHGIIAPDTGMVDAPIARAVNDRTRMAIRDCPSARNAVTTFTVLDRFEAGPHDEGYTLVECKLFTGRTHQIRVHMQYIKHPIVGDPVYRSGAPKRPEVSLGLDRQFLHSYRLRFPHPITGEEMAFSDGLPADLRDALARIQDRSRGRTETGIEVMEALETAVSSQIEGGVDD